MLSKQKWVSVSWKTERDMWTSKAANLPGTDISIASGAERQMAEISIPIQLDKRQRGISMCIENHDLVDRHPN